MTAGFQSSSVETIQEQPPGALTRAFRIINCSFQMNHRKTRLTEISFGVGGHLVVEVNKNSHKSSLDTL